MEVSMCSNKKQIHLTVLYKLSPKNKSSGVYVNKESFSKGKNGT